MNGLSSNSPLACYRLAVNMGDVTADEGQKRVMEILQRLYDRLQETVSPSLRGGRRPTRQSTSPLTRILRWIAASATPPRNDDSTPSGVYIWGDVGRGKSMIMDMFYESITGIPKKRIHFHAFIRDVHARMHAWRQLKPEDDLLPRVVRELASEYRLLCLDELQVHDVTDAMILSRLFTQLFELGVTVIFTSNRPPEELYQGGIQREQFVKFIELVKQRMEIAELISPHDYRLKQLKSAERTYIHPLGSHAEEALYQLYRVLTQGHASEPVKLEIQGRTLLVEKTARGVAWLTFAELCERPLGAGDYLELASVFHTLLLQDIPVLTPEKRNEAKRFITLIDALYEHKVKFICSAAVAPEILYPTGDGSFEFQRTVSRLIEMQSEEYMALEHVG